MILLEILAPLAMGALYLFLPAIQPNGLFFSVTVPEGYGRSEEAKRILSRYRFAVGVHVALALGLEWAWRRGPLLPRDALLAGVLWLVIWSMVAFAAGRRAVLPRSVDTWSVRQASLTPRGPEPATGFWLQFIALVPLLASGLALGLHWSSLPDRYPAHWNIHGQADRWVAKSAGSVFSILVVGLALCSVFAFLNWSIRNRTRRAAQSLGGVPPAQVRQVLVMRQFVLRVVFATQLFVATLFSVLALLPLISHDAAMLLTHALLAAAALFIVLLVAWSLTALSKQKNLPVAAGDLTPDQCWKAGIFYWNPNDPALFVEKRLGLGYTFNFARPSAWILLGLIIALPLVLVGLRHHV